MAARTVGMVDVDARLNEMAPEVMSAWLAFRTVERDPDEWLREIIKRGFAVLCNCQGAKISPDDLDPEHDKKERNQILSPREAAAQAALMFQR